MADDIAKILEANKEKGFVQRILHKDKYPVLANPPGYRGLKKSTSTHSMAADEIDGRYIVYPTVTYDGEKLTRAIDRDEAIHNAMSTGNFIEFKTQEEATAFSKNYKRYWDKPKAKPKKKENWTEIRVR